MAKYMMKNLTYEELVPQMVDAFFPNYTDKKEIENLPLYKVLITMLNTARTFKIQGVTDHLCSDDGHVKFAYLELTKLTPQMIISGIPNTLLKNFEANKVTDVAIIVYPEDPKTGKKLEDFIYISINKKGYSCGKGSSKQFAKNK